jgi:FemAB-related protein (PEP-CTERM system-associated)
VSREQNDDIRAFESLYDNSLRRLGTPSFPSAHFRNLLANFGSAANIREVVSGGAVVAAVMTFYFRDQVLPYYGASDPVYNALAPNNFMYFDLMRWGYTNGFKVFDFGRSKKNVPGSYDFKSHWGMVERELPYEMLLVRRKSLPNLSPANPVFDLPRRIWQRIPLPIAKLIGPHLVRLVP